MNEFLRVRDDSTAQRFVCSTTAGLSVYNYNGTMLKNKTELSTNKSLARDLSVTPRIFTYIEFVLGYFAFGRGCWNRTLLGSEYYIYSKLLECIFYNVSI